MSKEYNCDCEICKNYKDFEMPLDIIEAAKKGELVLFCGAGVSTESKNVLPETFYESIKNELGISDSTLSFSEIMQKYCDLPNGRRKLMKKIRDRFQYIHSFPELENRATMFHRELAELYFIKSIITTNWDTYFEECCAAIPITIPEDFVYWNEDERCVLKIHGSINNLGTIVATQSDYQRCQENLEKGIIGAKLKTILANNTVVFIGFSFGDEDFAYILDYVHSEMKELLPHIYIVTLDPHLHEKLEYKNTTCIVTDGTYFLHSLKKQLVNEKYIVNCGIKSDVEIQKYLIEEIHTRVAEMNYNEYPELIYCLAYQDGVCHAFDRLIQLYKTGSYNVPGAMQSLLRSYNDIVQNKQEKGNYWDASYYEGYLNGLMYILLCGKNDPMVSKFPFYYLPNTKKELKTFETFENELSRVSKKRGKYHKYAVTAVAKFRKADGIVLHHPPF